MNKEDLGEEQSVYGKWLCYIYACGTPGGKRRMHYRCCYIC
ncbi:hypothetical protein [aff. Roholtiella sp. LEGE 12411]|nr:hypothetical protein [aff. Roholtiella sp. LEGE 12411]